MWRFVVESGPDRGREMPLTEGNVYTVGRDPASSLPLQDDHSSRTHFKLKVKDGVLYVRDMNSRNGTLVNGERIEDTRPLRAGDRVQVGDTIFAVADDAAKRAASEPRPAPEGEDDSPSETSEKVIAGYRITGKLGRGGMGVVYRATQLSLNREVALKILSKKLTQNPTFIEKFIREARAAAQLNHPNVVQVFDVGNENDVYFISMEMVSGGTLQALINTNGKIPASQALPYAIDAARALVFAQKKGLVHRDIKPDNLMISEAGVVKIADLGLARNLQESLESAKAEAGGVFGTPHFVSPEQAQGQKVDGRSDIYSLGATLYTLLAGSTPFHGKTAAEIVSQQIKAQPIPLRDIDPEIPEDVADLVAKMMQKDPAARFANADELLAELERILRAHHYGRRGPGAKIAIFASVLIAGGAVTWVVLQKPAAAPVQANGGTRIVERVDPAKERELRESKAQVALSEAQIFEKDHGRTEETAARYDAVAGNFGDVDAGRKASEIAAAIRTEVSAAKQATEARSARLNSLVEGLRKECGAALDAGRFAAAFASVVGSPAVKELQGTQRESDVQALLADVRTKATDAVARYAADAAKPDELDLTAIIDRARPLQDALALPADVGTDDDRRFFADLSTKVGESRTATERRREVAEAAVRDHDRDIFFAAVKEACALDEALKFDASAAKIAAIEGQLATQAYRARAKELRDESQRIAALKAHWVDAIASGPLHGQEFPLAKETNGIATGRAMVADANGVTLEIDFAGQGRSTQTIPWDGYPRAVLIEALRTRLAKDGPSRLALAAMAVRSGLGREAISILDDAAKDAGSPEAAEAERQKERATREMEAADRIATVRLQFAQGKYRDALRGVEELRAGYSDTLAFLESSSGKSHYVK
ncbi:MAG: protein kinase [Planctomycetes bacterium]|nr:protein kinase [Planctomycetota bacterium]